jgi:hypothetical protein
MLHDFRYIKNTLALGFHYAEQDAQKFFSILYAKVVTWVIWNSEFASIFGWFMSFSYVMGATFYSNMDTISSWFWWCWTRKMPSYWWQEVAVLERCCWWPKVLRATHKTQLPPFKKACGKPKGDTHHCRTIPGCFWWTIITQLCCALAAAGEKLSC